MCVCVCVCVCCVCVCVYVRICAPRAASVLQRAVQEQKIFLINSWRQKGAAAKHKTTHSATHAIKTKKKKTRSYSRICSCFILSFFSFYVHSAALEDRQRFKYPSPNPKKKMKPTQPTRAGNSSSLFFLGFRIEQEIFYTHHSSQ